MIRLLIIILSFNTFVAPISAQGQCCLEMMEMTPKLGNLVKSNSISETMIAMEMGSAGDCLTWCDKNTDNSCGILDCTYSSSFSINDQLSASHRSDFSGHERISTAPLYKTVLPINTPPPLV